MLFSMIKEFNQKNGEIFGIRSFFTDEKRETSVISHNFSTIFEIRKQDFLQEIKKNSLDYVHFYHFY